MSNLAAIGFSLSTTAGWGTANFLGGYASRRTNPFVLATIAHLCLAKIESAFVRVMSLAGGL